MNRARQGFTLIELVLAMGFVSFLLLAIAMTILQISGTYNHGMLMKDINQSARSMASDMQETVASSAPFDVSAGAGRYIESSAGARLCTGRYSYVWNTGGALAANQSNLAKYASGTDVIRFIKVEDSSAALCANTTSSIDPSKATELLAGSDHDLAVQYFSITSPATAINELTNERLYTVIFYLGTNDSSALTSDRLACKQPGETGADINYCSVQKFSIVVSTSSVGL